jgi:hypothetical protein
MGGILIWISPDAGVSIAALSLTALYAYLSENIRIFLAPAIAIIFIMAARKHE